MPEVAVKTPPLPLDGPEYPGVVYGRADFQLIADNAGILLQLIQFFRAVSADLLQLKAIESLSEGLLLVEDTLSGELRLEAFQNQHFKQLMVIVDGNAPFFIVVSDVKWILGVSPTASAFSQ